jgi:hypothetical protein
MSVLFKEKQRFRQWWFWIFLLPLGCLPLIGIYVQFIKGEPWGDKPMSDMGLIFFSVLIYGLILLFYKLELVTVINQYGIHIRFLPFVKKKIKWNEVSYAETIKYRFLGGWGIRLFTRYGTAYNVKGNQGLHLILKNDKQLLIGTQRLEKLKEVIEKYRGVYHFD